MTLGCCVTARIACRSTTGPARIDPPRAGIYTAALDVRSLAPDGRGGAWAATAGGVLHWDASFERPRRWTTSDGLLSNDVRVISADGDGARLQTAAGACRITPDGEAQPELPEISINPDSPDPPEAWPVTAEDIRHWRVTGNTLYDLDEPAPLDLPAGCGAVITEVARSGHGLIVASAMGLWRWKDRRWQAVPLPAGSPASHVSALAAKGDIVYAGLHGDGLYRLEGMDWSRVKAPDISRDLTSIALSGHSLIVASRDGGVSVSSMDRTGTALGAWRRLSAPDCLPSGDIQSMAYWNGMLCAATFDRGIIQIDRNGAHAGGMSEGAPANIRQLIPAGDRLYARDADGHMKVWNNGAWQEASWSVALPRHEVYSASYSDGDLIVGGWAGWARIRNDQVEAHYKDPALQKHVITAIASVGDTVWIGTQDIGLLRFRNGVYTEYHEAQGITDDWITAINAGHGHVLVGTYTGGLLSMEGSRFQQALRPGRYAVRAIATKEDGSAYMATPLGVYRHSPSSLWTVWTLLDPRVTGGTESQCLCLVDGDTPSAGLWIGSRTALIGPCD